MPSAGMDIGISSAAQASKMKRLGQSKGHMKEVVRRSQILQLSPLLSQIPLG